MSAPPLRIVLELSSTGEPIEGSMVVEGLPAREFSGWMGLTRALELTLTDARRARPGLPPGQPLTLTTTSYPRIETEEAP
ncbi:MAG: hypothetical protein ACRDYD_14325 [Acidimicrobiales bacterium]